MFESVVVAIDVGKVDTGHTDSSVGSFADYEWFALVLGLAVAAVAAAVVEVSTSPLRHQLSEPVSL